MEYTKETINTICLQRGELNGRRMGKKREHFIIYPLEPSDFLFLYHYLCYISKEYTNLKSLYQEVELGSFLVFVARGTMSSKVSRDTLYQVVQEVLHRN